jgi:AraC-like DNA-binding protein
MDRDVRFHHVVQDLRIIEGRACARQWVLFHETYTLGLLGDARRGKADWRYRHRSFVIGSQHMVMAMQPGELHATLGKTPAWDFIALQVGDALMRSVAADLGWQSPALNVRLARAGFTHPEMVAALSAFRATLCQTLFAAQGACTCARQAGPILEALAGVVLSFIRHYAEPAREIAHPKRGAAVLRKAREYLHAHYRDAYDLERVAAASGCSKYYLAHLFKEEFGIPPSLYHARLLISKTCEVLIRFPDRPLEHVAREVGWPSRNANVAQADRAKVLIKNFRRALGTTPDRFRAPLRDALLELAVPLRSDAGSLQRLS